MARSLQRLGEDELAEARLPRTSRSHSTALLRISAPEENCLRLGAAAKALPQLLESHRVTGSDRLVMKVAATSVGDLDEIISDLSKYGTVMAAIVLKARAGTVARPSPDGGNRGRKAS